MLAFLFTLMVTNVYADSADINHFSTQISEQVAADLGKYYSPRIEGRTLYIKGTISSHIYDFLSLEEKNVRDNVDVIEFNSIGGSTEWALESARKISELKKTTKLSSGSLCASACVYLFAAGTKRQMDDDTWLGFHGARLGAGFFTTFWGKCFVDLDDGGAQWMPHMKGCQEVVQHGYEEALATTNAGFDFMEKMGVSPEFRNHFFAMDDDPAWPSVGNMLKKPDWILNKTEAAKYGLVN